MIKKEPDDKIATDDLKQRVQALEEKFEYQDRTIDTLSDVIIEQQNQLDSLEDRLRRLQALLIAAQDHQEDGEEPPPPHY